jgi:predicted transposase/invertase (TIGR01784 family)
VLFREAPDYHLSFHLLEDRHHFPMTEDLEFHFLELPKFNKGLDDLKTGLDVWLYFLRHGEMIDDAALPAVLARPTIIRAVEVLRMITQSDIEREKYEARLKYQLDQNTLNNALRRAEDTARQAEQRGEQRGKQIGLIQAFERILQRPATPEEQLLAMPLEDLTRLAAELEKQALSGG